MNEKSTNLMVEDILAHLKEACNVLYYSDLRNPLYYPKIAIFLENDSHLYSDDAISIVLKYVTHPIV